MFHPETARRVGFSLTDVLATLFIMFIAIGVLLISLRLRKLESASVELRKPVEVRWPVEVHKPATALTRANFNRIELGMTRQQVQDVLGGPPGFYDGGKEFCEANCGPYFFLVFRDVDWHDAWIAPEVAVAVGFDEVDRVACKAVYPK
jgi:hypothetical protein